MTTAKKKIETNISNFNKSSTRERVVIIHEIGRLLCEKETTELTPKLVEHAVEKMVSWTKAGKYANDTADVIIETMVKFFNTTKLDATKQSVYNALNEIAHAENSLSAAWKNADQFIRHSNYRPKTA